MTLIFFCDTICDKFSNLVFSIILQIQMFWKHIRIEFKLLYLIIFSEIIIFSIYKINALKLSNFSILGSRKITDEICLQRIAEKPSKNEHDHAGKKSLTVKRIALECFF